MINRIDSVVSAITSAEKELVEIENKGAEMTAEVLTNLIEKALPGITFEKITGSRSRSGRQDYPIRHTNLDTMGAYLFTMIDGSASTGKGRGTINDAEVFIHKDGTLHIYTRCGNWSQWRSDGEDWDRRYAHPVSMHKVNYKQAFNGITRLLGIRLAKLTERAQTQKKRIEQIGALQLD